MGEEKIEGHGRYFKKSSRKIRSGKEIQARKISQFKSVKALVIAW